MRIRTGKKEYGKCCRALKKNLQKIRKVKTQDHKTVTLGEKKEGDLRREKKEKNHQAIKKIDPGNIGRGESPLPPPPSKKK